MTSHPVRDRVVAVVLALAAILLAGVIVQAATAINESERELYQQVQLDERARLADGTTGAFVGIRVGDRLQRRDEFAATSGRWVVVDLRVWAETRQPPLIEVELWWQGNRYRPVDDDYEPAPPGFTSIRSSAFEVPAEAVGEFTLVAGRVEIVQGHQHFLRVAPPADPGRMADSVGRTVALTESKLEVAR